MNKCEEAIDIFLGLSDKFKPKEFIDVNIKECLKNLQIELNELEVQLTNIYSKKSLIQKILDKHNT